MNQTKHNKMIEAWHITDDLRLLHGEIVKEQFTARGEITFETDAGDLLTLPQARIQVTPAGVRYALLDLIKRVAQMSDLFDREQAVLIAPSLVARGERYYGMDV